MTRPGAETILVAEDDANIASLVARYLEREGFAARIASDGPSALSLAREGPILVILDLMLPDLDGWEVCRELRRRSDVPIIMLTARDEEVDRVAGLALGADDYVVKPFSPRELVERVKAVLRRSAPRIPPARVLQQDELALDPTRHRVSLREAPVPLTPSEFKLLETLMTAPGRVFTRSDLVERLHGGEGTVVERVVDVHVGNLRKKIERDPSHPRYVLTVRGVGYRFADPRETDG